MRAFAVWMSVRRSNCGRSNHSDSPQPRCRQTWSTVLPYKLVEKLLDHLWRDGIAI